MRQFTGRVARRGPLYMRFRQGFTDSMSRNVHKA